MAGGHNFDVIWSKSLSTFHQFGLSLAGFNLPNTGILLSFDAFLKNVTNSKGVINFNPHSHSSVFLIDFVVAVTSTDCRSAVELITYSIYFDT